MKLPTPELLPPPWLEKLPEPPLGRPNETEALELEPPSDLKVVLCGSYELRPLKRTPEPDLAKLPTLELLPPPLLEKLPEPPLERAYKADALELDPPSDLMEVPCGS